MHSLPQCITSTNLFNNATADSIGRLSGSKGRRAGEPPGPRAIPSPPKLWNGLVKEGRKKRERKTQRREPKEGRKEKRDKGGR